MVKYTNVKNKGKLPLFIGIDLHRLTWHVTARTEDVELFSGGIPGRWDSLKALLEKYPSDRITVVYEAGYFGFWLHDRLVAYGAQCMVTPPSLIPQEYGNHVKTNRRDSRKLAYFLAKGLLKRTWVPTEEERYHRQVIRRRRQLVGDRVRVQNRVKAELRFYGIELPEPRGKWTVTYVENLRRLRFNNRWMQESFKRLIEEYEFISQQITRQTALLRELATTELYRERVAILCSAPGNVAKTSFVFFFAAPVEINVVLENPADEGCGFPIVPMSESEGLVLVQHTYTGTNDIVIGTYQQS